MNTAGKSSSLLDGPLVHLALIVLLGLLAYSNTFDSPFIFDDIPNIVENTMIRDISNVPALLAGKNEIFSPRAVMHATLAMNYRFGGLDTTGYHIVNIAMHLLNGILLYFLVMITGRHLNNDEKDIRTVAALSAALFMLHPVQTEAVTNVVNRSALMAAMFYLSGMILFLKAVTAEKRRGLYIVGLLAVSMLGMGSRENFATFPLVLFLYDLFFISRFRPSEVARHYVAYLPVLLSLVYMAHLVLNSSYPRRVEILGMPPAEYALTQLKVHWTYLRLLLFPINQNLDYDYPASETLLELPTLLSFAGYLGLWVFGIVFARRRPVAAFSMLWFLIAFLPISFIVAMTGLKLGDVIFEHRLYLPSAGFSTATAAGAASLIKSMRRPNARLAAALTFCLVPVLLASAAHARNGVWRSELSIWHDVVKKSPGNARGWNDMGVALFRLGRYPEALMSFERAAELRPDYAEALYNKGAGLGSLGRHEDALMSFEKAIELRPDYAKAWFNKGVGLGLLGRREEARRAFEKAGELNPAYSVGSHPTLSTTTPFLPQ